MWGCEDLVVRPEKIVETSCEYVVATPETAAATNCERLTINSDSSDDYDEGKSGVPVDVAAVSESVGAKIDRFSNRHQLGRKVVGKIRDVINEFALKVLESEFSSKG